MRILTISDTHNRVGDTLDVLSQLGEYDTLIHLGDGISDLQRLRSNINADLICIKGNNDFSDVPLKRVIDVCGTRVLCTHGHTIGVKSDLTKLAAEAKHENCSIALFGHTHMMDDTTVDGVRLINPGSVGYPYGKRGAVELTDAGGTCNVRIIILN